MTIEQLNALLQLLPNLTPLVAGAISALLSSRGYNVDTLLIKARENNQDALAFIESEIARIEGLNEDK